jgi:hypothetical protein
MKPIHIHTLEKMKKLFDIRHSSFSAQQELAFFNVYFSSDRHILLYIYNCARVNLLKKNFKRK